MVHAIVRQLSEIAAPEAPRRTRGERNADTARRMREFFFENPWWVVGLSRDEWLEIPFSQRVGLF